MTSTKPNLHVHFGYLIIIWYLIIESIIILSLLFDSSTSFDSKIVYSDSKGKRKTICLLNPISPSCMNTFMTESSKYYAKMGLYTSWLLTLVLEILGALLVKIAVKNKSIMYFSVVCGALKSGILGAVLYFIIISEKDILLNAYQSILSPNCTFLNCPFSLNISITYGFSLFVLAFLLSLITCATLLLLALCGHETKNYVCVVGHDEMFEIVPIRVNSTYHSVPFSYHRTPTTYVSSCQITPTQITTIVLDTNERNELVVVE